MFVFQLFVHIFLWINQTLEYLSEGINQIISHNYDDMPPIGTQPYSGEASSHWLISDR